MIKRIEKIKAWQIFTATALVFVLGFVMVCGYHCIRETSARKDGTLVTHTLTADDFELRDIKKTEDGWRTTNHDSQMRLDKEQKFSSMKFTMDYSVEPGEIVVYYKEPGDEHYSEQKRLWAQPVDGTDNRYIVQMPVKQVTAIRLDPSMFAGNNLVFGDFVFNEEKQIADYFDVTYTHVFCLVLYTLVVSACLKYGQEFLTKKFD